MIDRRRVLVGAATAILVPLSARAQRSGNTWRIVFFSVASGPNPLADAFRRGLNELGYIEGRNLSIQYRWMAGHESQYDDVARELTESEPDVIVTAGHPPAAAAKKATAQIPIVAL